MKTAGLLLHRTPLNQQNSSDQSCGTKHQFVMHFYILVTHLHLRENESMWEGIVGLAYLWKTEECTEDLWCTTTPWLRRNSRWGKKVSAHCSKWSVNDKAAMSFGLYFTIHLQIQISIGHVCLHVVMTWIHWTWSIWILPKFLSFFGSRTVPWDFSEMYVFTQKMV